MRNTELDKYILHSHYSNIKHYYNCGILSAWREKNHKKGQLILSNAGEIQTRMVPDWGLVTQTACFVLCAQEKRAAPGQEELSSSRPGRHIFWKWSPVSLNHLGIQPLSIMIKSHWIHASLLYADGKMHEWDACDRIAIIYKYWLLTSFQICFKVTGEMSCCTQFNFVIVTHDSLFSALC